MDGNKSGWTPERRARQAVLIANWRPWEHSTGPRSKQGKDNVSMNAYVHGLRSAGIIAYLNEMRSALRGLVGER